MQSSKSKVISIRASDRKVIEFYENNRELCKNKILDLLFDLSDTKHEADDTKPATKDEADGDKVARSIADFNGEIDNLVRSDDFEDRMNELSDLLKRASKSVDEISTKLPTVSQIDHSLDRLFTKIVTRLASTMILIALVYFTASVF